MEVKNFREKIILDAVVIFLVGFVSEIIMLKMTVWGIVKVVEGYIEWVVIVVIIVLILKYGLVSKKVKIGESLVYVGYGFIPVLLGEIINEVLGLYRPNILGEVVTMAGIETYLNLGIYYWIYFLIPKVIIIISELGMIMVIGWGIKKVYKIKLVWGLYISFGVVILVRYLVLGLMVVMI